MVSTGAGAVEIAAGVQQAVAELHEAAGVMRRERFQPWALQRVRELIPFVTAVWGTRHPITRTTHSLIVHGVFAGPPGTTLRTSPTEWRLLATARDTNSPLETVLVAERPEGGPAFTRDERDAFTLLAQHLLVAWRNCQRIDVLAKAAATPGHCVALVDAFGFVDFADRGFLAQLRTQWPRASGSQLPDPLRAFVTRVAAAPRTAETAAGTFGATRWHVELSGHACYLIGKPLGALARLTLREQTIAATIIEGCSYEESATRLGISVNTLRNTVARIYRKLGVNNRLDLARRAQFDANCQDGCCA